jgi:D-sedoheptulose 7-phosphate isomerase
MDRYRYVERQIRDSLTLRESMLNEVNVLLAIADEIVQAFRNGNKVLFLGNGGSAADAQHLATEFLGRFLIERQALPAISLTTNTSSLTAIANDYSYDMVFTRQVQALAQPGDVVFSISTSGNSNNVLLAMEEAKRRGAITVALTGTNGKLRQMADYAICIPSSDTPRIQEEHIAAGHLICQLVEEILFGDGGSA